MFYCDVPAHRWLMFGSQAARSADRHSDFDVILSGPSREELEHPFFQDTLKTLRKYSVEAGGVLDLFLEEPGGHRLDSVFSPGTRAIDAGSKYHEQIMAEAIEMTPQHFHRALGHFVARGRDPIESEEQFYWRQEAKIEKWRSIEVASLPAEQTAAGFSNDSMQNFVSR